MPSWLGSLWWVFPVWIQEFYRRDLNRPEWIAVWILSPVAIAIAVFWRHASARIPWRFPAPREWRAVAMVAAAALVARLLLLPVDPVPQPHVHDEFSYLLQADTFMHGRLANPTPALWRNFETMHVFF